jgi:hypothetical protein
MINCRFLLRFLRDGLGFLLHVSRNCLRSRQSLVLENLALRSQLALFEQRVSNSHFFQQDVIDRRDLLDDRRHAVGIGVVKHLAGD